MQLDNNPDIFSDLHRKIHEGKIIKEGMEIWNNRKEMDRLKKLKEQKEVRQMLENYWPWSVHNERPRGFKNMYHDGIYPIEDFEKSKRCVGNLGASKPGGGSPMITSSGKKVVRTKEDPLLRFQWSDDLRRTVDNTLRYKKSKQEQEEYRKQLDKMVKEKKLMKEQEERDALEYERKLFLQSPPWGKPGPGGNLWRHPKDIGFEFLKSMGWTDKYTLDKIKKERDNYRQKKLSNVRLKPIENKSIEENVVHFKRKDQRNNSFKQSSLLPFSENVKGKRDGSANDLVPIIAEKRGNLKIPLGTTDVTRGIPDYSFATHKRGNSKYLQELTKQMEVKSLRNKEMKIMENNQFRNHFSTWESFWGRPGNGAPRSVTKKGCLDRLLYPQMVPISVH